MTQPPPHPADPQQPLHDPRAHDPRSTPQQPGPWPQQAGAQMPGVQHPGTPQTGTQHPGTQQPGTQHPGTQQPGTQHPGTQQPGTQHPGTQQPGAPLPGTQHPGVTGPQPVASVAPAQGLAGWFERRAAREASTPVELRVARLGVRSALIGALIGALVAGGLSYAVQLRAEASATVTTLQESRQDAYAELIAGTSTYLDDARDFGAVATTAGSNPDTLQLGLATFSDSSTAVTVATSRAHLVGSSDVAEAVSTIETLSSQVYTELTLAYAANLSGADSVTLDEHWATYTDLSEQLRTALDGFTALAREDIGTDRD